MTSKGSMKIRYAAALSALFLTLSVAPAQSTAVVDPYNFSAKTIGGASFKGSVLTGKPTVMWFWAPWCSICRAESPDLVALAKTFKNQINIVGVAGLGNLKEMKGFVSDTKTGGFTQLADVSGKVWNFFGVARQPTLIFISRTGEITRHGGALQKSILFSTTKNLIQGT